MPGYTCDCICEDGKSIDAKYLCPYCEKVLRDPFQTSCGHRYCKTCVEPLLRYKYVKRLFMNWLNVFPFLDPQNRFLCINAVMTVSLYCAY